MCYKYVTFVLLIEYPCTEIIYIGKFSFFTCEVMSDTIIYYMLVGGR